MASRSDLTTRYTYLVRAKASDHFGVLPATLSVVGGMSDSADNTLHGSWRPEFRRDLYEALGPLLSAKCATTSGALGPTGLLQASGLGLINPLRELLWFGLHLVARVRDGSRAVELLIDDRAGLRYAEVMKVVADLYPDVKFYLTLVRARRGQLHELRLPLSGVTSAFRAWGSGRQHLLNRWGRQRGESADGASVSAAFFETTEMGWKSSEPIALEMLDRGFDVLLASPWRRELRTSDGSTRELRPETDFRISVKRSTVENRLLETLQRAGSSMVPGDVERRFVAKLLARRAMIYVPAVEGAVASARLAVGELGAAVTMQEGHGSPAARSFLLESQRLGARTFTTHHGMVDESAPERNYLVSPDVSLEWGEFQAPFRSASTKFVQVGSAFLEERVDRVLESRRSHVPSGRVLIAFGRPGRIVDPEFFASTIRLVAAASERLSALTFHVTIHSGDRRAFWDVVLRRYEGDHRLILSEGSIESLLAQADVLVTTHSTAGAEAILTDVPVVSIGTHRDPDNGVVHHAAFTPPYVTEGAATMIDSLESLVETLRSLVDAGPSRVTREAMERFGRRFLSRTPEATSLQRAAGALAESIEAAKAADGGQSAK